MSFWSGLASLFVPQPDHQRDAWDFPPLDEQMRAITSRNASARPWRPASVKEALGVPAIWGAVSLISNTVGTLSMEAYRRGLLMEDAPRLIERPNPFSVPRVFFRDTAFYLATRGEAWWWVAQRDPRDGTALSLVPVPPWEVVVEQNDRDRLRPTIKWNDRVMRNEDMRQITYMTSGADGRGTGPLQQSGAAVSVAVEADAWAANFYSGAMPSIVGTTDQELDEEELLAFDRQWLEKPNNLPRWMSLGMKLEEPPYNAQKAQLTETRQHQVSEVARMFLIPGSLLEYNMPGASLRYQNDEQIWRDFQGRCLSPNYLEPIEQEISDLLPMSTAARFNLDQLLRSDAKTRAEVYDKLIPLNVITSEEARRKEGYAPGAVDFAAVRPSPPQAVPERLPFERSALQDVHCAKCGRLVGRAAGAFETRCKRCGEMVRSAA